jgi:hypothetical protein
MARNSYCHHVIARHSITGEPIERIDGDNALGLWRFFGADGPAAWLHEPDAIAVASFETITSTNRWAEYQAGIVLFSLPVHAPDRPRLSEVIRLSERTLASRCRKLLSLSPVFQRANPLTVDQWPTPAEPIYPSWCQGTRQSITVPFESGRNTLPGMERFADLV